MSPRSFEQYEKMKNDKESLIIKTALFCFSEDGFKGASMQSIAEKASISKGNLYNYFESKEALLESVIRYGLDQFSEFYGHLESNISSEEEFEMIIRKNFDMIKSNKLFWKLYFNIVAQPAAQVLFTQIIGPYMEAYIKTFEFYFSIKGDKNPSMTALLLGSSIDGICLGYLMMEDQYPLEKIVNELIEKFK